MPLYEYECKKCHRKSEKIRKFSDPPLTVCESCGGKLEQLLSSPAIRFKGSGFYINDYAKKSTDATASSSAVTSPSTEKKESAKDKGAEKAKEAPKSTKPAKSSSSKE